MSLLNEEKTYFRRKYTSPEMRRHMIRGMVRILRLKSER